MQRIARVQKEEEEQIFTYVGPFFSNSPWCTQSSDASAAVATGGDIRLHIDDDEEDDPYEAHGHQERIVAWCEWTADPPPANLTALLLELWRTLH